MSGPPFVGVCVGGPRNGQEASSPTRFLLVRHRPPSKGLILPEITVRYVWKELEQDEPEDPAGLWKYQGQNFAWPA